MNPEQPIAGNTCTATAEGFPSGLVGTIGVQILAADTNTVVTARTTAGIIESPASSGTYVATLTAPAAGAYRVFWDTGVISPSTTGEEPFTVLAAAGTAFASVGDLATRFGLTLTADEQTRAASLLEEATGIIQDTVAQTIFKVTGDTLTRPAVYDDRMRLPQRPVISVASVTIDGVAVDSSLWYLDSDEIVRTGILPFRTEFNQGRWGGWGGPRHTIVVVYTHGYETVPRLAKNICMEMVARVWGNPGSVVQESIGDTSTVYSSYSAPPRGLALTDDEERRLSKKFRRTQGSIQQR